MFKKNILFLFVSILSMSMTLQAQHKNSVKKSASFNFQKWQQRYGKRVDLDQWRKKHPAPWSQYFAKDKPECAKTWYVNLGPLGLRTLMHDNYNSQFPAFKDIFPRCLLNANGKMRYECFEVLFVDPAGPSYGKIKEGDLIIAIDGQKFKNAKDMYLGKEVLAKSSRSLEIHAGQLIDAAEGRGKIGLTVIRLPEGERNQRGLGEKKLSKAIKTIKYLIPAIGSFGSEFDPKCSKLRNFSKILAERIAIQQEDDGSWKTGGTYSGATFHTSMCGLALMSTGDSAYNEQIRKAAYYIAYSGDFTDWSYPSGVNALFLGEYYLRTKDKGILKGLRCALDHASDNVLSDYTAGHKYHPGYRGCGWIGGGGAIAAAFAVASHTPIRTYNKLLDKMLMRAQEIAPEGRIPYGRVGKRTDYKPSKGQAWSAGTGPYYLATMIRGGAKLFKDVVSKKYGNGPWGDADGGHASYTLQFFWSSLASNMTGSKGQKGNMDAFLWYFVTRRQFDGFINLNTNRLEYHGAEGVLGFPYWRTAAMLTLVNAHKRNLAITGSPKFRAKKFRDKPIVYFWDKSLWQHALRNWEMVASCLGKKCPNSLKDGLWELRKLPMDKQLSANVFSFLNTKAPEVAKTVSSISGIKTLDRAYYVEMLLCVGHEISIGNVEKIGTHSSASSASSDCKLTVNSYTPFEKYNKAIDKGSQSGNPVKALIVRGKVVISDPAKKYLRNPITINIEPSSMKYEETVNLPSEKDYKLVAQFTYRCAGIDISYKRPLVVNSTHPMATLVNFRKVWVPGTLVESSMYYKFKIKLPSGGIIDAKQREGSQIIVYREGKSGPQGQMFHLLAGTPVKFLLSSGDMWEATAHEVKVLKNGSGILKPDKVTAEFASVDGRLENMFDLDQDTTVSIRSNSSRGYMYLNFTFDKAVSVASFAHYTQNSGHRYEMEYLKKGSFIPNWWGHLATNRYIHKYSPMKSTHFRLKIKGKQGTCLNIKELHLHKVQ